MNLYALCWVNAARLKMLWICSFTSYNLPKGPNPRKTTGVASGHRGRGMATTREVGTLWSDGNDLYLWCDVGYMTPHLSKWMGLWIWKEWILLCVNYTSTNLTYKKKSIKSFALWSCICHLKENAVTVLGSCCN